LTRLRQRMRMLDDVTFRNMAPNMMKVYSAAVANFSAFDGRSPDKRGIEDACGNPYASKPQ
jgi:hypothetical protein